MEEEVILEKATFEFSQEANCISDSNEIETLTIDFESSLGIDRDEGGFFVLKTDKWSVNDEQDLKKLFDRIKKLFNN